MQTQGIIWDECASCGDEYLIAEGHNCDWPGGCPNKNEDGDRCDDEVSCRYCDYVDAGGFETAKRLRLRQKNPEKWVPVEGYPGIFKHIG